MTEYFSCKTTNFDGFLMVTRSDPEKNLRCYSLNLSIKKILKEKIKKEEISFINKN
jgi:hypothetical protein